MKKIKLFGILFLIAACAMCVFVGCGSSTAYNGIKVTYKLCGGTYLNGEDEVTLYYQFPANAKRLIKDLPVDGDKNSELTNLGYVLDGWFTDETYTTQWDFSTDVVGDEGVTLYAKWKKEIEYLYVIGYDDNGKFTKVSSIDANRNVVFEKNLSDIRKAASKREGYTLIPESVRLAEEDKVYFDEKGHIKESETNVLIKVYVDYIEGDYILLYSAKDFSFESDVKGQGKSLLLMNDIDFNGEKLESSFRDAFSLNESGKPNFLGIHSYDPEGKGVAYSLKNYSIECVKNGKVKEPMAVGIFGKISGVTENDEVKTPIKISNVNFENVKVEVKILDSITRFYVSSFAESITGAEITNVKATSKVVSNRNKADFFFKAEKIYAREFEKATIKDCDFVIPTVETTKGVAIDLLDDDA